MCLLSKGIRVSVVSIEKGCCRAGLLEATYRQADGRETYIHAHCTHCRSWPVSCAVSSPVAASICGRLGADAVRHGLSEVVIKLPCCCCCCCFLLPCPLPFPPQPFLSPPLHPHPHKHHIGHAHHDQASLHAHACAGHPGQEGEKIIHHDDAGCLGAAGQGCTSREAAWWQSRYAALCVKVCVRVRMCGPWAVDRMAHEPGPPELQCARRDRLAKSGKQHGTAGQRQQRRLRRAGMAPRPQYIGPGMVLWFVGGWRAQHRELTPLGVPCHRAMSYFGLCSTGEDAPPRLSSACKHHRVHIHTLPPLHHHHHL